MKRYIYTPPTVWITFTLIFLNLFTYLTAEYERVLVDYTIEEFNGKKLVHFILDNDWVFDSTVDPLDEFKLYNLENLLYTRLRIEANSGEQGLRLILENPQMKGFDKINFQVDPTPQMLETLPTVSSLSERSYLFGITAQPLISLSDGSTWAVRVYNDYDKVKLFWNEGDRVFISREYGNMNHYMLVNVDIVGKQTVLHHKEDRECYYSIQDPRNVRVSGVE